VDVGGDPGVRAVFAAQGGFVVFNDAVILLHEL
jgi:hypothetical protein